MNANKWTMWKKIARLSNAYGYLGITRTHRGKGYTPRGCEWACGASVHAQQHRKMTSMVFKVDTPTVKIKTGPSDKEGKDVFPVRRVYCVGKNYAAHTIEMGGDPKKDPPCFFSKPSDAACNLDKIPYPTLTSNFHYEIEQVVAIGKQGRNIPVEEALGYVWGYAVGVDLTRRDLQAEAKKGGRPWDMSKGFDFSAPMSEIIPAEQVKDPLRGEIGLKVNGKTMQLSDLSKHTWNVPETLSCLSEYVELFPGDLVFMGTPEGIGSLKPGDEVDGWIEGINELHFKIV